MTRTLFLSVACAACVLPGSIHAATISWSVAQNITGDVAEVSTDGDFDRAYNFNATATVEINGVNFTNVAGFASVGSVGNPGSHSVSGAHTFTPLPGSQSSTVIGNTDTSASLPVSVTSAGYRSLLGGDIRAGGANGVTTPSPSGNAWQLTLTNLAVNTTYQVQLWFNDSRANSGGSRVGAVLSSPSNVAIDYNTSPTNAAGGLGQYITGTFTADAATQTIDFRSNSGDENVAAMLNGYQLRVIPEPSAVLLGAAGMGAFAGRRRRS